MTCTVNASRRRLPAMTRRANVYSRRTPGVHVAGGGGDRSVSRGYRSTIDTLTCRPLGSSNEPAASIVKAPWFTSWSVTRTTM